jgi:hypothetical protein
MADDLNARVDRLEEHERHIWAVLDALAVKQQQIDEVLAIIADAQVENERRFRETDERFRQTDERFRRTDERIDKLVSAIGEYIRKRDAEK